MDALNFGQWNGSEPADQRRRLTKLTAREREVFGLLAGPLTLAEIDAALFVSENTIKTHARNVYRKLGVVSRHGVADLAARWGAESTTGGHLAP